MKQFTIALVIAVLAVAMATSLTFQNVQARDEVNLKEGKVNVKSKNVDINIIGGEGKPGPKGDTGAQGPAGPAGAQGEIGPIGPAGPQGVQGEQGLPGVAGQNGTNGKDGVNGTNGKDGTSISDENLAIINDVIALYKNGSLTVNICYFSGNNTGQACPPVPGNTTDNTGNGTVDDNQTGPVVVPPVNDNGTNTDNNSTQPLPPVIPPVVDNGTNTDNGNQTDPIIIDNGDNGTVIENNTSTNSTPPATFSGFHIGGIKQ